MNIIFMGTPDFSVPSLEKLIENFDVSLVVTNPDRKRGRGKKLSFSPVKETALKHGIEVYQPEKLRKNEECINKIKELKPDAIVIVAFGQIIPQSIIDIPKYGCINLHASLLPKYRGAAPINWAIINGEKKTGSTTMLINAGIDTGDMLLQKETEISDDMTFGELYDKLKNEGADLLVETIKGLEENRIKPLKQDDSLSNYAPMIDKSTGKIDWSKPAHEVNNLIRGLNPKPGAYALYKDTAFKIFNAKVIDEDHDYKPGYVIEADKDGIKIAAGKGILDILVLQLPGKNKMEVKEFIKGHKIDQNVILD